MENGNKNENQPQGLEPERMPGTGPTRELRFSKADWNKDDFESLKRVFHQHPCKNTGWNTHTLNKKNATSFLQDHERCVDILYSAEGEPQYTAYIGCTAEKGCQNGLTYGLAMKKTQIPAPGGGDGSGGSDSNDPNTTRLTKDDFADPPGDKQKEYMDLRLDHILRLMNQNMQNTANHIAGQMQDLRTQLLAGQQQLTREMNEVRQLNEDRNRPNPQLSDSRRQARARREQQNRMTSDFEQPNQFRQPMPDQFTNLFGQQPQFLRRQQRPNQFDGGFQNQRQFENQTPEDQQSGDRNRRQNRFNNRRHEDESSVICIGEIRAPGNRQRHMSAEAEHALRNLQGEARSRNREATEKNGETYYESVVEESDLDDESTHRGSPYCVQALFEHKCSYDARASGNKDLSYTKREQKFDGLNFEKWSKDKHKNLWNFLFYNFLTNIIKKIIFLSNVKVKISSWSKYYDTMVQNRFAPIEIAYFVPKIFDQSLDEEIKTIVNETLENNLIVEYDFQFARERKDTDTMSTLKSGLISYQKVKKSTLVQIACQLGGVKNIADLPFWDKASGVKLKKWYRTLLDRQQVLHQSGTMSFNKYSEIMKRQAMKDLVNGLKERNDHVTMRQIISNKFITLFTEGKNPHYQCPPIAEIEMELETIEALANQFRDWNDEVKQQKSFSTQKAYNTEISDLKAQLDCLKVQMDNRPQTSNPVSQNENERSRDRRNNLKKLWNQNSKPKQGKFHSHFRDTIKPQIKQRIQNNFASLMTDTNINDIFDSLNFEIDFDDEGYNTSFDIDELEMTFEIEDASMDEEDVMQVPQRETNTMNITLTFKANGSNHSFKCLFDTGSTSNLIREDIIDKLRLQKFKEKLRYPKRVLGFGGTRTEITEWIKNAPCHAGIIPVEMSFLIVPRSSMPKHEIIIGFPGIKKLGMWEPLKSMVKFRLSEMKKNF